MSNYTVQVNSEQMDELIIQMLLNDFRSLTSDAQGIRESGRGWIYSLDATEDLAQIDPILEAFSKVLDFYGVKS